MAEHRIHGQRREELIRAGIEEINANGLANLSMRRVAEKCGISPGAPYKHFADRNEFLAAIIDYINARWSLIQQDISAKEPDIRQRLVAISMAYVDFLVENPHFRSIIMLKDSGFDSLYRDKRSKLTALSRELVTEYCTQVGMPPDVMLRKLYVIRALIYGAALMFDNGEMEYNEYTMGIVRYNIDREFDLP